MPSNSPVFEQAVSLLKKSATLAQYGFGKEPDIGYFPSGRERLGRIIFTKNEWKIRFPDRPEGYEGLYLHFESERTDVLHLHCELYHRQGREADHDQTKIRAMLDLKGAIGDQVRQAAARHGWAPKWRWSPWPKDLSDPANLQVGKFKLGTEPDCQPESFVNAVVRIVAGVTPDIDPVVDSCRRAFGR
ncbi:MAG TPA: hypothetical protein PKE29_03690 [Phycisphaerales bacterium]|nr:hypothetical protein [Phycisphaerales bacterium]